MESNQYLEDIMKKILTLLLALTMVLTMLAGCRMGGDETTGARRRYYAITDEGRVAYRRMMQEWQEASSLIEKLIRFDDVSNGEEPSARRI